MTASHRRPALGALGFALVFATVVGIAANAAEPLRLSFSEGDQYAFRHTLKTETDVKIPFPQKTIQTMRYTLDQRVTEVDAITGDATIEVRFRHVFVELDMGEMGGFKVDTADDHADDVATYRKLIDRPFTMLVTPRGEVLEVSGLTPLVQEILASDGASAVTMEQVETIVGDESMMSMYQSFQPVYPEEAMGKWETESTVSLPMMGPAATRVRWTLGESRHVDGHATTPAAAAAEVTTPSEPATVSLGFADMELRLRNMVSKGVIDISNRDGWPVKGEIKSDGVMGMKLSIPGLSMPTSSDMTVKSVAIIERLEVPTPEAATNE
jgi:hypothetical protein